MTQYVEIPVTQWEHLMRVLERIERQMGVGEVTHKEWYSAIEASAHIGHVRASTLSAWARGGLLPESVCKRGVKGMWLFASGWVNDEGREYPRRGEQVVIPKASKRPGRPRKVF